MSEFKIVTIFYDDRAGKLVAIYDDNYLRLKKSNLKQFADDFVCEAESFKNEVNK
jgi:hypothetical protein